MPTNPLLQLRNVLYGQVHDCRKNIIGKILTLVDACIMDRDQKKAIKDLINMIMYDEESFNNLNANIWQALLEYEKNKEKKGEQLTIDSK